MRMKSCMFAALALALAPAVPGAESPSPAPKTSTLGVAPTPSENGDAAGIAEKRYQEMLDRMQAAVEEVAELYGNPTFLQVFTNDAGRAAELKRRLAGAQSGERARLEIAALEKRRGELAADIALKEREAARMTAKLERQRAALDALAAAVEQARRAVEQTAQ